MSELSELRKQNALLLAKLQEASSGEPLSEQTKLDIWISDKLFVECVVHYEKLLAEGHDVYMMPSDRQPTLRGSESSCSQAILDRKKRYDGRFEAEGAYPDITSHKPSFDTIDPVKGISHTVPVYFRPSEWYERFKFIYRRIYTREEWFRCIPESVRKDVERVRHLTQIKPLDGGSDFPTSNSSVILARYYEFMSKNLADALVDAQMQANPAHPAARPGVFSLHDSARPMKK